MSPAELPLFQSLSRRGHGGTHTSARATLEASASFRVHAAQFKLYITYIRSVAAPRAVGCGVGPGLCARQDQQQLRRGAGTNNAGGRTAPDSKRPNREGATKYEHSLTVWTCSLHKMPYMPIAMANSSRV